MRRLIPLTIFLVLCGSVFLVEGVGFRFHADKRSGQKRLWIHVPGSDPNVLTDFEEKPYNGPKNLVDVNRPSDGKRLARPHPRKKQQQQVLGESPLGKLQSNPSLPYTLAGHDGYHYPKPDTPFGIPPQVGYPDVPEEENFGVGQNSEEVGRPSTTPASAAAEQFRPRPKSTTPSPDSDAAEQFKPRPKPTSPVYCPTVAEGIAYGRPRPANCIPRPRPENGYYYPRPDKPFTATTPPDSDAAEVFKPRPKPSTPVSPVYCPTAAEIAHGRPRPANCIPRPTSKPQTTTPPDSDAAEVFKPRPKPTIYPTTDQPPLCPEEGMDGFYRPRPHNCRPRPTAELPLCPEQSENGYDRPNAPKPTNCQPRPTTTPSPDSDAAEVFKPRPKPTTPPPDSDAAEAFKPRPKPSTPPSPVPCPTDAEIAFGKARPENCVPRPTTTKPTTTTPPDSDAAEVFKPRPKTTTTPRPVYCPPAIGYPQPRPANCIPRPTTPIPPLCPEEGMDGFYRPRPHNCRPRPTQPTTSTTRTTTPPDSDAAEVFKPRPKPSTPSTPIFCPTEAEIAYGRSRPENCIPRPTRPPTTTPPDADAAEVFKPRPKTTTTQASPVYCPKETQPEFGFTKPRPANCIPRPTTPRPTRPPTTTPPDSDAAEVFKPRPKTTTTSSPLPFCPGRRTTPQPRTDHQSTKPHKCRPRPTTTTPPPDSDAAEVFKPRPKPATPASPVYCPTEAEIRQGRPRPTNCIPRPTRPPVPREPEIGYIPPPPPPPPYLPPQGPEGCGYGYDPCPGEIPIIRRPTYGVYPSSGWRPSGNQGSFAQGIPPRNQGWQTYGTPGCGPGYPFPCGHRRVEPPPRGRSQPQGGHGYRSFGGTQQVGFLRSGSRNRPFRQNQNEFDPKINNNNRGDFSQGGGSGSGSRNFPAFTTTARQTSGGTVIYVTNHQGIRPGSSKRNRYGSSFSRNRPSNTENFLDNVIITQTRNNQKLRL